MALKRFIIIMNVHLDEKDALNEAKKVISIS